MLTIRRAMPPDAAALSAFGRRSFHEAFAADSNADDMEHYLSSAFSKEQQLAELADAAIVTLMAEADGVLVAYAQLRSGEAPSCVVGEAPVELVRFYVDRAWHGRHVAQALMREAESAAAAVGRTFWLGVWERNARALAFYAKCSFVDVGSHVFQLGDDRQIDRVMAKPLPPSTF